VSAFFTWASTEFQFDNPMPGVPAPKFEDAPMKPFTRNEIEKLLKAAEFCHEAKSIRRRCFVMRRPTARRVHALILLLLDTGLCASELRALSVGNVNLELGQVQVKPGAAGGAKGGRGWVVFLARRPGVHCGGISRAAPTERTRTRRCRRLRAWASCSGGSTRLGCGR
jgi:integrase